MDDSPHSSHARIKFTCEGNDRDSLSPDLACRKEKEEKEINFCSSLRRRRKFCEEYEVSVQRSTCFIGYH